MNGRYVDPGISPSGQGTFGYYLVRLDRSIQFQGSGDVGKEAEIQRGELRFHLDDWGEAIRAVDFQIAAFGPKETGVISLRGGGNRDAGHSHIDIADGMHSGEFLIECGASYLDERMVADSELEYDDEHTFTSPSDFLRGSFSGTLQWTDGGDGEGASLLLQSAKLKFEGNAKWQEIEIVIPEDAQAERLSFQCGGEATPVYHKTLKLQLVGFKAEADDNQVTSARATEMIQIAEKLWNPGFIDFDYVITAPVIDPELEDINPRTAANRAKLWASRPIQNEIDRIPVFFVNFDLGQLGGGDTQGFAINTMTPHASVVISEFAVSDLVLAHELGHVMGGQHPDSAAPGYWIGTSGTVMKKFPFEKINGHENCVKAGCPVPGCEDYSARECLEPGSWSL